MKITLDYGRTGLDVDLPDPNILGVLNLTPAPPLPDPAQAVRQRLDAPIGTQPLRALAEGCRSACPPSALRMRYSAPYCFRRSLLISRSTSASSSTAKITGFAAINFFLPRNPARALFVAAL